MINDYFWWAFLIFFNSITIVFIISKIVLDYATRVFVYRRGLCNNTFISDTFVIVFFRFYIFTDAIVLRFDILTDTIVIS